MNKCHIRIRVEPQKIHYLDNLLEGFDGLAIISTGNPKTGEVTVHVTPNTFDDVMGILKELPWPIQIIE